METKMVGWKDRVAAVMASRRVSANPRVVRTKDGRWLGVGETTRAADGASDEFLYGKFGRLISAREANAAGLLPYPPDAYERA